MKFIKPSLVPMVPAALLAGLFLLVPVTAQEGEGQAGKKPEDPAAAEASKAAAGDSNLAEEAAEALRKGGQVVSQSGDLNIAVERNWFEKFPGFDLEDMGAAQKDWLLKRANAVFCTCGCRGDTVARCVVMDPTCQTARQMLTTLVERAASLSDEELARQAKQFEEEAAQAKPE